MFPPMPQFQGRQVVTLHNQRDFLFFRRHRLVLPHPHNFGTTELISFIPRYAFRSTEKAALQEIGPRFTLKLKSLRTGLPAVKEFGEPKTKLDFDKFDHDMMVDERQPEEVDDNRKDGVLEPEQESKIKPPTVDEYQWQWKVSDFFSRFMRQGADSKCHSHNLKPIDAHSFCSLCLHSRFFMLPHHSRFIPTPFFCHGVDDTAKSAFPYHIWGRGR